MKSTSGEVRRLPACQSVIKRPSAPAPTPGRRHCWRQHPERDAGATLHFDLDAILFAASPDNDIGGYIFALDSRKHAWLKPIADLGGEMDVPANKPISSTVTRSDLAAAIRQVISCSTPDARSYLDVVLEEIATALIEGRTVKLQNFGNFQVREKTARIGRNPRTMEDVIIEPRRVLKFRPSTLMIAALNEDASS